MNNLLYFALILLSGIGMARLVSRFKLPHVTGYLLAGVLMGPSILGIIPLNIAEGMNIVSEAALGFIAYSIGSEINFKKLRKVGKSLTIITFFEALTPVILVTLAMVYIFKQPLPFAITIGAIAAATAPAATIMIISQYKAKGPLVDTLLPVVAMDDGLAIVSFGVAFTIAKSLMSASGTISFATAVLLPLWEITLSLGIGFLTGLALAYAIPKIKGEDELLSVVISAVFIAIGISAFAHASTLLVCMMLGITITNFSHNSIRAINIINRVTPPIFIAFFTLAGVELNLSVLRYAGLIGIGYIVFRSIGKTLGANIGARITNSPAMVTKYLGLTLLPQAGVAIGLSMVAQTVMPEFGATIRTVILASTVVYEVFGPVIAKNALIRAGEIDPSQI